MRIAILGAGGFVGSHLVEALAASEHQVVGVDLSAAKLAGIPRDAYRFVEADIRHEREVVADLIRSSDVVANLVAATGPHRSVTAPLDVIDRTFLAGLEVARVCAEHETRLIQYSSSEVYGRPTSVVLSEDRSDLVLGPVHKSRWTYAASKQLLERAVHGFGIEHGLDYTILRPFNLVGPRYDYLVPAGTDRRPRMFAQFMSALLAGDPLYLVDGGVRRRSFTHIDDGTAAFLTVLDHPRARGEIYNVGNPFNRALISDIAELLRGLF